MTIDYSLVIKRLQRLEEYYVAYAVSTNMPYVTCDKETCNDQIWMFGTSEAVQEFIAPYLANKIPLKGTRVPKESMPEFYMDVHSMGINEIVFCDGGVQHKLELSKVVRLPDFHRLPESQRPLMNPTLQLSSAYFFQEIRRPGLTPESPEMASQETLNSLAEEMYANLARSKFLLPVQIFPTQDGKGKLSLPFITTRQGDNYQPIFSDQNQYLKHTKLHKPMEHTKVLLLDVHDLQKHLLPNVKGFMLNPDTYCHVLNVKQLNFIRQEFGCKFRPNGALIPK